MTERPLRMNLRALDLFCGAGGASMGLHRAGFDVTGVDIKPQPRYPFRFVQADALEPPFDLTKFDFIWASPPCQAYSVAAHMMRLGGKAYPDLVVLVRRMLVESGVAYAIENVPGSPLIHPTKLRGTMFPELRVVRERWFETSWFMLQPMQVNEPRNLIFDHGYVSVAGHGTQGWAHKRGLRWSADLMRKCMGIDWMNRNELSQAIPPAYSEFIGRAFLAQMREAAE
jgi:DNA (cytosine-5)-methyltransferase 1